MSGSNTVFTDDIANDTQPASGGNPAGGLVAADLRPGSVGSSEVINGALNDEDVGQGTFAFHGNIGNVPAHDCVDRPVTGVNARLDHVLLSANWQTSVSNDLSYDVLHTSGIGPDQGSVVIRVCNPTASAIDDGTTDFKLLVIDAQ